MQPLCVFLCSSKESYHIILESTKEEGFHRMFILGSKFQADPKYKQDTDSVIVYDFENLDYNLISRMIVAYSNQIYSHFFIFKDEYLSIDDCLNKIKNLSKYEQEFLYFSKEYVVFQGYDFCMKNEIILNEFDKYENITKALSGEKVEDKYFILAIEELLPQNAKFVFHESAENLPIKYKKLFSSSASETVFEIFYNPQNAPDNAMIFSDKSFEYFKYKLSNLDGMNFYIT